MNWPWPWKKRTLRPPPPPLSGKENMKSTVEMPKKIRIAVEDLAFQLEMSPDALLTECFLAHMPALEARRKALENHIFPKPILSEDNN